MERLGGGGHMNVAGAQLEDITMADAKNTVINVVTDMIEEGDI